MSPRYALAAKSRWLYNYAIGWSMNWRICCLRIAGILFESVWACCDEIQHVAYLIKFHLRSIGDALQFANVLRKRLFHRIQCRIVGFLCFFGNGVKIIQMIESTTSQVELTSFRSIIERQIVLVQRTRQLQKALDQRSECATLVLGDRALGGNCITRMIRLWTT